MDWYSNPATPEAAISNKLADLAPLYASVTGAGFGNLTGDALEIIVFKCLEETFQAAPAHAYLGAFHLAEPKNQHGRYRKTQPPKHIGKNRTLKEADFIQFGHAAGPLCIECKNYREWIYPHHQIIRDLIIKSSQLGAIPVLVARRIHYTTRANFLEPAGIIAHESYYQYYPEDKGALAASARHKRSLGFTDVLASETPHPRTTKFFSELLPSIVPWMSQRWRRIERREFDALEGINLVSTSRHQFPAGGRRRTSMSHQTTGPGSSHSRVCRIGLRKCMPVKGKPDSSSVAKLSPSHVILHIGKPSR